MVLTQAPGRSGNSGNVRGKARAHITSGGGRTRPRWTSSTLGTPANHAPNMRPQDATWGVGAASWAPAKAAADAQAAYSPTCGVMQAGFLIVPLHSQFHVGRPTKPMTATPHVSSQPLVRRARSEGRTHDPRLLRPAYPSADPLGARLMPRAPPGSGAALAAILRIAQLKFLVGLAARAPDGQRHGHAGAVGGGHTGHVEATRGVNDACGVTTRARAGLGARQRTMQACVRQADGDKGGLPRRCQDLGWRADMKGQRGLGGNS